MLARHVLDNDRSIEYQILGEFVLVNFVYYLDSDTLINDVRTYFNYFGNLPGVSFLGGYPGTPNPIFIDSVLRIVKEKGFNYRIFYDKEEIAAADLNNFEITTLNPSLVVAKAKQKRGRQAVCDLDLGNRFKPCAVFCPLIENIPVKTPVKYYRLDATNTFIDELEHKPNDNSLYYSSVRLSELFRTKIIKLENNKPVFYPK